MGSRLSGRIKKLEKTKNEGRNTTHIIFATKEESSEEAKRKYKLNNPEAQDGDFYLILHMLHTDFTKTE